MGGGPLEPGGELQEPVGVPLGPVGGLQQMEEGGPLGLEDGHLELEGGPQEQEDGPQMLVGGPLVLAGGSQELGVAAGEGLGVLRVQAHWVAWGAEAGLLEGVGAKTQAVAAVGANHSSVGVVAASPQEARQGDSAGPEASPS